MEVRRMYAIEDLAVEIARTQVSHNLTEEQEERLRKAVRPYGPEASIRDINELVKRLGI